MNKGVGYIYSQVIERNHSTKSINWNETNKLRDEQGNLPLNKDGKVKMIYFTEDEWLKVNWKRGTIDNINSYKFIMADGKVGLGFRNMFSDQNKFNPNLKLNYEYVPYIHKDNISNITVHWIDKNIKLSIKKACEIIKKEFNDNRKENTIMLYIVKVCKGIKMKGFPFNFKFNLEKDGI